MWKKREDEEQAGITGSAYSYEKRSAEVAGTANIGKSVVIKGDLTGSEDLYIDGQVEGSVSVRGHDLVVGPNGRIRADIEARGVVVHGKVDGNVQAIERVELKKTGVLVGNIRTQRIAIEDGAYFKGGVDVSKDHAAPEQKPGGESLRSASSAAASASSSSTPAATAAKPAAAPIQPKLPEQRKS